MGAGFIIVQILDPPIKHLFVYRLNKYPTQAYHQMITQIPILRRLLLESIGLIVS